MKSLRFPAAAAIALVAAMLAAPPIRARADAPSPPIATPITLSYTDLVDLAIGAPWVVRAQVRKVAVVEPARAANVRPGWARLYIEAVPLARLTGGAPLPPLLRYLADVPRDAKGRVPEWKKRIVLLFAQPAPPRAEAEEGELRLVASDAQLPDDPELEARVRTVIAQLAAPDAPGVLSAVREAIYVPGTLAGSGETQIFLATTAGAPASISVEHAPGQAARWSASFSEVVDATGRPPPPGTLAWYRLACALPGALPPGTNVSESPADQAQAAADYRFVLAGLGNCGRTRG